jgi:predicted nucleic acid-binding protein
MELLLDTSVLIDVLRSRNQRRELLAELVEKGHRLSTTAFNIAEVYAGMHSDEESRTAVFLDSLHCHPLSAVAGRRAGLLKANWAKNGRTLALADTIIAEIAIEQNCTLMTDNRKDFPMPELHLYPMP